MLAAITLCASTADSQTLVGPVASASFSADYLSVAGSLGYKFSPIMTLGIELTWNSLDYAPQDVLTPSRFATVTYANPSRDVVSFTTNVKVEWPNRSRITPYGVAGGGISSDKARVTRIIEYAVGPDSFVETQPESVVSQTSLTLLLGGGAGIALNERLSIDVDLRGFYFRGYSDFALARVAGGISFRF